MCICVRDGKYRSCTTFQVKLENNDMFFLNPLRCTTNNNHIPINISTVTHLSCLNLQYL